MRFVFKSHEYRNNLLLKDKISKYVSKSNENQESYFDLIYILYT